MTHEMYPITPCGWDTIWDVKRINNQSMNLKKQCVNFFRRNGFANSMKTGSLFGERTHDIKTLRIGPWVKDRILLIDLGFYKHHIFTRIVENGGFFVSRLKGTADPMIISVNSICRGHSIDVIG